MAWNSATCACAAARSSCVSPESFSYTTTVGIEFGSWNGSSFSSARVDSALAGSQDAASLFWTSASFEENAPRPTKATSQAASTIHLVTGPVSLPAI